MTQEKLKEMKEFLAALHKRRIVRADRIWLEGQTQWSAADFNATLRALMQTDAVRVFCRVSKVAFFHDRRVYSRGKIKQLLGNDLHPEYKFGGMSMVVTNTGRLLDPDTWDKSLLSCREDSTIHANICVYNSGSEPSRLLV